MGNRTTTICDAAACGAEQENPMIGRSTVQPPGWGKLLASDAKTSFPSSWDLCPAHVEKIAALLGLPTATEQQQALYPSLYAEPPSPPLLPPKTCSKCLQPYVGDSCYFCVEPA